MSKSRKKELEDAISADQALIDKYNAVKNAISGAGYTEKITVSGVADQLGYFQSVIDTINNTPGYASYLSPLSEKLTTRRKTIEDYNHFIEDSSQAFANLYSTLSSQVTTLTTRRDDKKRTLDSLQSGKKK